MSGFAPASRSVCALCGAALPDPDARCAACGLHPQLGPAARDPFRVRGMAILAAALVIVYALTLLAIYAVR